MMVFMPLVSELRPDLTTTLHLTLKMTTAQVVETSVTNNNLSEDYPTHSDDHAKQINYKLILREEYKTAFNHNTTG